jgi:tetratricopeptide (TPR) repeat protein
MKVSTLALVALAPALVAAGAASPRPPLPAAAAAARSGDAGYWDLVELYREGRHEEALAGLAGLRPQDRFRAVKAVADLAARARRCEHCPPREKLEARPLLAAVMLHTDRAWREPLADVVALREAMSLLDAARLDARNEDFARRWYLAMTLKAHASTDGALTVQTGRDGLLLFPEDPQLLLAVGVLEEALATPSSGGPLGLQGAALDTARLREAEKDLGGAAANNLTTVAAEIHLGRVQALLGEREASATLTRALGAATDPRLVYLARLYLGSLEEAEGHLRRAAEHYRRATEVVPEGQAARIALSYVLRRDGDLRGADRALGAALRWPPRAADADPYWRYPWGSSGEADRLLGELRGAAQ